MKYEDGRLKIEVQIKQGTPEAIKLAEDSIKLLGLIISGHLSAEDLPLMGLTFGVLGAHASHLHDMVATELHRLAITNN